MIPYGRQEISQADIDSVVAVLQSDFLTQGPKVPEFEGVLISQTGAKFAVAMNSATSALHAACLALGLGPGDRLWTSPITFVASANCGLYCGASVDFVDIDPFTYNMSPIALANKLEEAALVQQLPKIIVVVHLCGQPADMKSISILAKKYGIKVIEDASHAIGARYLNEPVGNCKYSDITIFSFHPVKIITTAEGGAALTNSESLAETMGLLRSHGITRDPGKMTETTHGAWYYQQIALGFNYRMTELQGALGTSQMSRLDDFVSARQQRAQRYDDQLSSLPLVTPMNPSECQSAWHLYVIRLKLDKLSKSHSDIFHSLRKKGVGVNLHYIPVHLQPYYRRMGFKPGDFPNAEKYYVEAISLPMFHSLTWEDQDYVVESLKLALIG